MRYLEHVILEISTHFLPDLAALNPEEKLKKVLIYYLSEPIDAYSP